MHVSLIDILVVGELIDPFEQDFRESRELVGPFAVATVGSIIVIGFGNFDLPAGSPAGLPILWCGR